MMKTIKDRQTAKVTDPVCGMEVKDVGFYHSNHQDKTYYFCSRQCQKKFEEHPDQFPGFHENKKKGLWCRYLERLGKATGGRSMKCH